MAVSLPSASVIGPDYVVRSPKEDIVLPESDIYSTIAARLEKFGTRIAMVDGVTGVEHSCEKLHKDVCKFSSSLQRMGVVKSDVVVLVIPSMPECAVVNLGTLRSGGIMSSCNYTSTVFELTARIQQLQPKVVVALPDNLAKIQEAAKHSNVEKIVVVGLKEAEQYQADSPTILSYEAMLKEEGSSILDAVPTKPEDIALLLFSSGTTGLPKGIPLTHFNVISSIFQTSPQDYFSSECSESDCVVIFLPSYHIGGFMLIFISLYAGLKIVTQPRYDFEVLMKLISEYKITIILAGPPVLRFLANDPMVENYDLSSLNEISTGGAPVSTDVVNKVVQRTGCKFIRQIYAMTEASSSIFFVPRSVGMKYVGSVGPCVGSVKAKIQHLATRENLPPNSVGEICVQGPNFMKGYWNNPEATSNALKDGWLNTGDIGYYNEEGFFYICGRIKEVIKVLGYSVAPAEIELVLLAHPKICDAAVVGVSDERLGESPKGFIVKKDVSLEEKEVHEYLAQKLDEYKQLTAGVVFVDQIPRDGLGKVQRQKLK